MPQRFSTLDMAALVAFGIVSAILVERSHQHDIEAPSTSIGASATQSCQELLENRRFAIRRMLIADGSLPLGNIWRNDALIGACLAN